MPVGDGRVVDRRWRVEDVFGTPNAVTAFGAAALKWLVVPLVAALGHVALRVHNELAVDDDGYEAFEKAVRSRDPNAGLLTVSNHSSVLDDPFLLAALVPLPLAADPRRARWATCSQEVCFSRGPLVSAFFGAGKTLPIKRGGGIDQPALKALATKLAAGKWVHFFPEGHVYQFGRIGVGKGSHDNVRDEATRRKLGTSLKRGTAKLIAHAPTPLLVLPFVHQGMSALMPYDSTGKCESKFWKWNQRVRVRFGQPIDFQDIIADHERRHGPLPRYDAEGRHWPCRATHTDNELYTKILIRIEATLLDLQRAQLASSSF